MTYYLGIDIGTTYTAAAVWRDGRCDIASLGNRAPTIPSVVLLRDDQAVLTGEAAVRRAATEPDRVAREFKRRIGDPTPIIVGSTPYSADSLVAKLLRAVVDQVTAVEGGRPAGLAVSHPANWGAYKLDLMRQAISLADLDGVATVTEPEAAAIHYASLERVEPGSVIAVYDLGGGTFDAAVLRKTAAGWEILGQPEGIERLGGVDFDAAVFHHVTRAIGGAIDELDADDPTAQAAVARLRQECVDAKEALSSDSDVSIPVLLPNMQTEVRLTRAEYEQMVRPALSDTITALNRALRSAEVKPDDVTAVLLVGGSSRTPLVSEMVSSMLGRPVAVDAHPKYGVALGAAITAAHRALGEAATGVGPTPGEAPGGGAAGRATAAGAAGVAGAALGGAALAGAAAAGLEATTEAPHHARPDPFPGGDARPGPLVAPSPMGAPGGPDTAGGAPPAPAGPVTPGGTPPAPVGPLTPGGPSAPTEPTPDAAAGWAPPRSADAPTEAQERTTGAYGAAPYGAATRPEQALGTGGPPSGDDIAPGGPDGDGGGGSRRSLGMVAAGVVVVALLGVGAYLGLSGGDGGGDDDTTTDGGGEVEETNEPDVTDPPESTAPTTTATTLPDTPYVQINDVVLEGEQYRVNYQISGFEALVDGGPDSLHIHFFLDTTAPENAGNNGNPVGDWNLTDEPQSFLTDYGPGNRGAAGQMCAAVATVTHDVHLQGTTTGNCVDLPA
jgi:actin-like ATPase involved in cell morphogenesis